ncbi:hypothetical protein S40288_00934 [Stachybotrys chartarum IBT 40288]|nr:hypothetical protein S40288_00934 [Stachybotrys chartarum IBT 40288]
MLSRRRTSLVAFGLMVLGLLCLWTGRQTARYPPAPLPQWEASDDANYFWKTLNKDYPVASFQKLPHSRIRQFPKVQASASDFTPGKHELYAQRRQAVKETFTRCWNAYRHHAWMADEVKPTSGGRRNPFGGWAATLVDSLDTLWIMDMKDEFGEAVAAAASIDFTKTDLELVNVFETTIRYLGGFLSAYDLSGDPRLLRKAVQVGEMIYKAFDTPNHMPVTRWDFARAKAGRKQLAKSGVILAEIGSLCLEFTRLTQLTDDDKWFDASQRIMDMLAEQQDSTLLPGLWPVAVNTNTATFNEATSFSLGAMADSVYEYLPKMAALLGGQLPIYEKMYEKAMDTALKHNIFRPMTPNSEDILISGQIHVRDREGEQYFDLEPQNQHLVCFLGGLMALGGKLFSRQQDLNAAAKLTDGCIYSYSAFPHGVMPETLYMVPCESRETCPWNETLWKQGVSRQNKMDSGDVALADALIAKDHLPPGFTRVADKAYLLRPEAIESVFTLYRVTAQERYAEHAWDMFTAIEKATRTNYANTAVADVTDGAKSPEGRNSMESFWMGETLKYFYLIFSEPDLISLDEYVFNTEAHPLRRLLA